MSPDPQTELTQRVDIIPRDMNVGIIRHHKNASAPPNLAAWSQPHQLKIGSGVRTPSSAIDGGGSTQPAQTSVLVNGKPHDSDDEMEEASGSCAGRKVGGVSVKRQMANKKEKPSMLKRITTTLFACTSVNEPLSPTHETSAISSSRPIRMPSPMLPPVDPKWDAAGKDVGPIGTFSRQKDAKVGEPEAISPKCGVLSRSSTKEEEGGLPTESVKKQTEKEGDEEGVLLTQILPSPLEKAGKEGGLLTENSTNPTEKAGKEDDVPIEILASTEDKKGNEGAVLLTEILTSPLEKKREKGGLLTESLTNPTKKEGEEVDLPTKILVCTEDEEDEGVLLTEILTSPTEPEDEEASSGVLMIRDSSWGQASIIMESTSIKAEHRRTLTMEELEALWKENALFDTELGYEDSPKVSAQLSETGGLKVSQAEARNNLDLEQVLLSSPIRPVLTDGSKDGEVSPLKLAGKKTAGNAGRGRKRRNVARKAARMRRASSSSDENFRPAARDTWGDEASERSSAESLGSGDGVEDEEKKEHVPWEEAHIRSSSALDAPSPVGEFSKDVVLQQARSAMQNADMELELHGRPDASEEEMMNRTQGQPLEPGPSPGGTPVEKHGLNHWLEGAVSQTQKEGWAASLAALACGADPAGGEPDFKVDEKLVPVVSASEPVLAKVDRKGLLLGAGVMGTHSHSPSMVLRRELSIPTSGMEALLGHAEPQKLVIVAHRGATSRPRRRSGSFSGSIDEMSQLSHWSVGDKNGKPATKHRRHLSLSSLDLKMEETVPVGSIEDKAGGNASTHPEEEEPTEDEMDILWADNGVVKRDLDTLWGTGGQKDEGVRARSSKSSSSRDRLPSESAQKNANSSRGTNVKASLDKQLSTDPVNRWRRNAEAGMGRWGPWGRDVGKAPQELLVEGKDQVQNASTVPGAADYVPGELSIGHVEKRSDGAASETDVLSAHVETKSSLGKVEEQEKLPQALSEAPDGVLNGLAESEQGPAHAYMPNDDAAPISTGPQEAVHLATGPLTQHKSPFALAEAGGEVEETSHPAIKALPALIQPDDVAKSRALSPQGFLGKIGSWFGRSESKKGMKVQDLEAAVETEADDPSPLDSDAGLKSVELATVQTPAATVAPLAQQELSPELEVSEEAMSSAAAPAAASPLAPSLSDARTLPESNADASEKLEEEAIGTKASTRMEGVQVLVPVVMQEAVSEKEEVTEKENTVRTSVDSEVPSQPPEVESKPNARPRASRRGTSLGILDFSSLFYSAPLQVGDPPPEVEFDGKARGTAGESEPHADTRKHSEIYLESTGALSSVAPKSPRYVHEENTGAKGISGYMIEYTHRFSHAPGTSAHIEPSDITNLPSPLPPSSTSNSWGAPNNVAGDADIAAPEVAEPDPDVVAVPRATPRNDVAGDGLLPNDKEASASETEEEEQQAEGTTGQPEGPLLAPIATARDRPAGAENETETDVISSEVALNSEAHNPSASPWVDSNTSASKQVAGDLPSAYKGPHNDVPVGGSRRGHTRRRTRSRELPPTMVFVVEDTTEAGPYGRLKEGKQAISGSTATQATAVDFEAARKRNEKSRSKKASSHYRSASADSAAWEAPGPSVGSWMWEKELAYYGVSTRSSSMSKIHLTGPSAQASSLYAEQLSVRGPMEDAQAIAAEAEQWSWLYMEFLEGLLGGLTGSTPGGGSLEHLHHGNAAPSSPGSTSSTGTSMSRGARLPNQVSSAAAAREFEALRRKFSGTAESLQLVKNDHIRDVFTQGMACWLKFWEAWGDGVPKWARRDEAGMALVTPIRKEMSQMPAGGSDLAEPGKESTLGGPAGGERLRTRVERSLQVRVLSEMFRAADNMPGGRRLGLHEALQHLGFACWLYAWQPATSALCLLMLLDYLARSEAGDGGTASANIAAIHIFVISCLENLLLSHPRLRNGPSSPARCQRGQPVIAPQRWTPPKLAALAEAQLAESMGAISNVRDRFEQVDRLYDELSLGPGLLANLLVAHVGTMRHVAYRDTIALAGILERSGCEEAAFQAVLHCVASGHMDQAGFVVAIRLAFGGDGHRPVQARFSRLAAAVKLAQAQGRAAADGSYISDFVDAMLEPSAQNLTQSHPWAYEVTLNFLRLHSTGGTLASRERDLTAETILSRWLNSQTPEERVGGYVNVAMRMSDPEKEMGWPVWCRIGVMLEERHLSMSTLLFAMRCKAVLGTWEKVDEQGQSSDPAALEAFDWGLEGLLKGLPKQKSASTLVRQLAAHRAIQVDLVLAIASRLLVKEYEAFGSTNKNGALIAKLFCYSYDSGRMSPEQVRRAVALGLRLWGWAMPDPRALSQQLGTDEARDVMEHSVINMWKSVAEAGMSPMGMER